MFNEEFGSQRMTSFLKSEDNLISNVIHCWGGGRDQCGLLRIESRPSLLHLWKIEDKSFKWRIMGMMDNGL